MTIPANAAEPGHGPPPDFEGVGKGTTVGVGEGGGTGVKVGSGVSVGKGVLVAGGDWPPEDGGCTGGACVTTPGTWVATSGGT